MGKKPRAYSPVLTASQLSRSHNAAGKVHRASAPDGSGVGRLLLRELSIGSHPTREHLSYARCLPEHALGDAHKGVESIDRDLG